MLLNLTDKYIFVHEPVAEALNARGLQMLACASSMENEQPVFHIDAGKNNKSVGRIKVIMTPEEAMAPTGVATLKERINAVIDEAGWASSGEADENQQGG